MTERIIESLVGPESEGTTLLEHLCRRFTYCDRAQWQIFLDDGRLLVDGQPGNADQRLVSGQRLEFMPPSDLEPAVDASFSIVYETSRLLVVNKPPLLPIHPGGRFFAHTLWYLLTRDVGKVHIATRLDRETSGLVLVAKDAVTARHLQEQQSLGAIHKTYLALVHGNFPAGWMSAWGWLVPDRQSAVRKKRHFLPMLASGSNCWSHPWTPGCAYQYAFPETGTPDHTDHNEPPEPGAESCGTVLTGKGCHQAAEGPRSLVEARLLTGRTHQIRATLYSLGFPVVGDKLYGLDDGFFLRFIDDTLTPEDISRLVLPYQALHCASLEFKDSDGNKLEFSVQATWAGMVNTSEHENKS